MNDFNFSASYGFNDGALIANITINKNNQEFRDEIPFFYNHGFMLESVLNAIDEPMTDEQEQLIEQSLNELTFKVRADIKKELMLSSINIISHDCGELKFYLNFMDYCFTCKHHDGEDQFYILQEQLSFTNNTELWTECEFLAWGDIVI